MVMHPKHLWRLSSVLNSHKISLNELHFSYKRANGYLRLVSNHRYYPKRPCSSLAVDERNGTVFRGSEDRHKGIRVEFSDDESMASEQEFGQRLKASLKTWREAGHIAAWLQFPIQQSSLIPEAARHGFVFHHAEGDTCCLYRWLDDDHEDRVPRFASHQVGVAGCVVREDTQEVLMVQDKNRPYTLWKFPGGLSELAEDISSTAEREVFEETGIKADFQGLLSFRQQHHMPNAFGRSDMFFVCHLKAQTFELRPDYENEIAKCQWMGIQQILDNPETSTFTNNICCLLKHGIDNGFHRIHFGSKRLQSVYKGLEFTMFYPQIINEVTES